MFKSKTLITRKLLSIRRWIIALIVFALLCAFSPFNFTIDQSLRDLENNCFSNKTEIIAYYPNKPSHFSFKKVITFSRNENFVIFAAHRFDILKGWNVIGNVHMDMLYNRQHFNVKSCAIIDEKHLKVFYFGYVADDRIEQLVISGEYFKFNPSEYANQLKDYNDLFGKYEIEVNSFENECGVRAFSLEYDEIDRSKFFSFSHSIITGYDKDGTEIDCYDTSSMLIGF